MTTEKLARRSDEVALAGPNLIDVNQLSIIQANIELLETRVKAMLRPGEDYGRLPGMQKPTLFDSGAGTIRAVYNIYPDQEIILHEENSEGIRYVMKVKGIHRATGQVVASGVGSASSGEIKYAYRWVDARGLGNQPREGLKTKPGYQGVTLYRIDNPDIPDLDNTLLKMAAKRAEVDMTLQLPGVSRVFTQDVGDKPKTAPRSQPQQPVDASTGEILESPEATASQEGQGKPTSQVVGIEPKSEAVPATPQKAHAPDRPTVDLRQAKDAILEYWQLTTKRSRQESIDDLGKAGAAREQRLDHKLRDVDYVAWLEEMKAEAPQV